MLTYDDHFASIGYFPMSIVQLGHFTAIIVQGLDILQQPVFNEKVQKHFFRTFVTITILQGGHFAMQQKKKKIKRLFGHFVPEKILQKIGHFVPFRSIAGDSGLILQAVQHLT